MLTVSFPFFRNLEKRSILTLKLQSLEHQLNAKDEEQRMLSRRNHLEAKNFKIQICNEKKKYKALYQRLEQVTDKQQIDSEQSSTKEVFDYANYFYLYT